jgi:hypothetical protein
MVYISLTTVPKRLICWTSIQENLESLLKQKTDKEYYVIFNIPELYTMDDNTKYIIPDELLGFTKNNPKLIINRDIFDYGPIIKIYGALKYATDPNDIIIALDDDNVYHEDMLEFHIKKLNEYPNCAICFTGDIAARKIDFIEDGIKKFKMGWSIVGFPLQEDAYLRSPGHVGSVSYKRSFFEDDFNEKLFALADGDDPLMAYYLKKHQIPIICAKHGYLDVPTFPIVRGLSFPEDAAGSLIRKKHPQTVHGRQSKELTDLINDNDHIYIEKTQMIKMKLIFRLRGIIDDSTSCYIFNGYYDWFKKNNPDINIEYDDVSHIKKLISSNENGSGYFLIIKNPANSKYIVVSYWDYMPDLLIHGSGWDVNNCVEIITSSGIRDNAYNIKYTPFTYALYMKSDELIVKNSFIPFADKKYYEEPFFRGLLYGTRKFLHEIHPDQIVGDCIPKNDYIKELSDRKICLSLNGAAEITYRDLEILGTGSVLLRPLLKGKFYNDLTPWVHYVPFEDFGVTACRINPANQWNEIETVFNKIKNDENLLSKISQNGLEWYKKNGTIDANIEILKKVIDVNKLKFEKHEPVYGGQIKDIISYGYQKTNKTLASANIVPQKTQKPPRHRDLRLIPKRVPNKSIKSKDIFTHQKTFLVNNRNSKNKKP